MMKFQHSDPIINSNLGGSDVNSRNSSGFNSQEALNDFASDLDRFDLESEPEEIEITYLSSRADENFDQLHRDLEAYLYPGSFPRSTRPTWELTALDRNRARLVINDPIEELRSHLLTVQLTGKADETIVVDITTNNKDWDLVWEAIGSEFDLGYWRVINLHRPTKPTSPIARKKR